MKSSNHNYDMIDQTSPIKTQPETVPKELQLTLTCCPKFVPVVTCAHSSTCATTQSHTPYASYALHAPFTATSALVMSAFIDFDRHR